MLSRDLHEDHSRLQKARGTPGFAFIVDMRTADPMSIEWDTDGMDPRRLTRMFTSEA
jgi:hypothetical protein